MYQTEQIVLKVDGMTCANCARSVENAVEENGGTNISVNLADKEVVFEFVSGADVEIVKKNIQKRGYTVLADNIDIPKKKS
jgi:Cu+-exporting ATPase